MALPTDYNARKGLPIFDGVLMYFPDAIAAVSHVSKLGNDQHNPGEPLHWARGKSMDQMNTAVRHLMDHGTGGRYDADGGRHLAKAAWRVLAALQLDIEQEQSCLVDTTPSTSSNTKKPPSKSRSGKRATKPATISSARAKSTKATG